MQTYGGKVIPSPSNETKIGRELLKDKNNYNGSLGIAISEAVEVAMENKDTHYTLGSVLEPRSSTPDDHRRRSKDRDGIDR